MSRSGTKHSQQAKGDQDVVLQIVGGYNNWVILAHGYNGVFGALSAWCCSSKDL